MAVNQNIREVALILGGTSGIGLSVSRMLLSRNISPIIVGRSESKLEKAKETLSSTSGCVETWLADLSDASSWISVVENIQSLPSGTWLRYVVNSAGVFIPKSFLDHTEEDYKVCLYVYTCMRVREHFHI